MKTLPYKEGSWFAVPLRQGGYATGLVGRVSPKGKIVVAFFFGPKREKVPDFSQIRNLRRAEAIKCLRAGDLGLINGEWPIIGGFKLLDHHLWPVPPFFRKESLSGKKFLLIYNDSDPSKLECETEIENTDGLEEDSLYGYGAVEILLTKILR